MDYSMSNANDFGISTKTVGSLESFPDTLGNVISYSGQVYLKTGVIALASAYPQVPAALQVLTPQFSSNEITPVAFTIIAASVALGLFVACDGTNIYSSATGLAGSWTNRQAFPANNLYWTGTRFIATNGTTTYWSSTTGITWTTGTLPVAGANATVNSRVVQVGTFVIITTTVATYSYSIDSGANWLSGTYPNGEFGNNVNCQASSTTFVFAGAANIYTCNNGVTWTVSPAIAFASAPIYSDGTYLYFAAPISGANYTFMLSTYVIGGGASGIFRSLDGVTWTFIGGSSASSTQLARCFAVNGYLMVPPSYNAPHQFSLDGGINLRNLPDTYAGGTFSPSYVGAVLAYITGVYLGIHPMNGLKIRRWTTALPTVDNFTTSSNVAGSRNYMRVA